MQPRFKAEEGCLPITDLLGQGTCLNSPEATARASRGQADTPGTRGRIPVGRAAFAGLPAITSGQQRTVSGLPTRCHSGPVFSGTLKATLPEKCCTLPRDVRARAAVIQSSVSPTSYFFLFYFFLSSPEDIPVDF